MTARPIRRNAQTPDRNGKIFYTSTTSLSHISKYAGVFSYMDNHKHPSLSDNETELFSSLHIRQFVATDSDDFGENKNFSILRQILEWLIVL